MWIDIVLCNLCFPHMFTTINHHKMIHHSDFSWNILSSAFLYMFNDYDAFLFYIQNLVGNKIIWPRQPLQPASKRWILSVSYTLWEEIFVDSRDSAWILILPKFSILRYHEIVYHNICLTYFHFNHLHNVISLAMCIYSYINVFCSTKIKKY